MNTDNYWQRQISKHRKAAATLRAKHEKTGEARWLKQAETNERTARAIERTLRGA